MSLLRKILHGGRSDSGLTLTELLVTLSVLGFVLSLGYMIMQTAADASLRLETKMTLEAETRLIIDDLTRELRQAAEIQEGEGVFDRSEPRWCAFYVDLDHDTIPEYVEYRVVGQEFRKIVSAATIPVYPYDFEEVSEETLIISFKQGWTGSVFEYYDGEDPPNVLDSSSGHQASAVELHLTNSDNVKNTEIWVDLSTWVKVRSVNNTLD